jgi:para-nitrobenzyl esterase
MAWDEAVAKGESLAASLGAPQADADELRALAATDVAMLPALLLQNEIPIVDPVLPKSVAATFEAGEEADVPYIVGATDLEMIPKFFVPLGIDANVLSQELVKGRQAEALAAYEGDAELFRRHFPNDVVFGEPARSLALAHADNAPTYFYRFSIVDPQTKEQFGGALHGADYPFVFGYGAGAPGVPGADELAADISACWAGFAKGDSPECGGVEWPEVGEGELLDFTNDGPKALTDDPWAERLDLVESIIAALT